MLTFKFQLYQVAVFTIQGFLGIVLLYLGDKFHQASFIHHILALADDETRVLVVFHQTELGEVRHVYMFLLGGVRLRVAMEGGVIPLGKAARQVGHTFRQRKDVIHKVVTHIVVRQFHRDGLGVFGVGAVVGLVLLFPAHHHAHIVAVLHQVDAHGLLLTVHHSDGLRRSAMEQRVGEHSNVVALGQREQGQAAVVQAGILARTVVHCLVVILVAPHHEAVVAARQFNFFRIVVCKCRCSLIGNLFHQLAGFIEHKHIHLAYLLVEKIHIHAVFLRGVHGVGQCQLQGAGRWFGLGFRFRRHYGRRTVRHVLLDTSGHTAQ